MPVAIQRPRVLLIDDDSSFRKLMMHELRQRFFVVDAPDGCDGFTRAISSPPDMILLDMEMDGWDGLETLRRMREHPRLQRVPVVMLTSDSQRSSVLEAIRLGATDYLLKDHVKRNDLIARIVQHLPYSVAE